MSTNITKQGTSLQETSTEELQKLSQKAGMTPRTPAGATGIGANPDQAKMAGTPAQKKAASPIRTDGPTAPGSTLDQAARLTPPSAQAMTAPEKLDRMKQLGSLNTQVEGLVQGYMQQLQSQQAALSLNTTALEMAPASQRPALEAALNEYKGALTEQQRESAVIKAGQALGRPLSAAEMQGYFAGTPEAVGQLAKNVTPETVKLSDLQLSASGVNIPAIAADLGVSEDELAGLTLPQLNQKIEEIRQSEFAESEQAQAEALSAVGNRAKQLQGERQAIGQSGRMGYEAQFQGLQDEIEKAGEIEIAGQKTSIDKLLSDETLSRIVSGAAISSAELNKLKQTEPALAQWVEQYKSALIDLSKEAGLVASDVAETQLEAEKLKENVSSDLFGAVFGEAPDMYSKEELDALKASMSASPLWQKLNADANFRSRLELSPERAAELQGLDAASLDTLMNATKTAEANPVLSDLAGYTPGGLLTPAQADFVNMWKDELSALPPAIASDKTFQDMLKSGQLTEAHAMLLAESPELWDEYRAEQTAAKEITKVKTAEDLVDMVMPGFTLPDFNEMMDGLKAWAATGDQNALAYYTKLSSALTGPDGRLDMNDVQKVLQGMSSASLGDILGGKEGIAGMLQRLTKDMQGAQGTVTKAATNPANKVAIMALDYLKNDQRIDEAEMLQIMKTNPIESVKQLLDSPWVPNKNELAQVYNTQAKVQSAPAINDMLAFVKGIPGMANLTLNPDGTLPWEKTPLGVAASNLDMEAAKGIKKEDLAAYKDWLSKLRGVYREKGQALYNDPSYAQAEQVVDSLVKFLDSTIYMQEINAIPNYGDIQVYGINTSGGGGAPSGGKISSSKPVTQKKKPGGEI